MRSSLISIVMALAVGCGGNPEEPPDVDASPDAISFECPPCGAEEICVQLFDGVCGTDGPACVPTALDCPAGSCTADCEAALCGEGPYQCEIRTACGTEAPGAFTCYGP